MKSVYLQFIIICCCVLSVASLSCAQSPNQNFPTPITANEISGTIKARDIGDSRLTSYFYVLEASQGDLFINIVTRNFTGDLDFFLPAGLRSLTKVVVYSDLSENETGRLIYLRKPEKLLLRVQGRSPNDYPATFRIKFAGSFIASSDTGAAAEPELPDIKTQDDSGIRVNSVGTIIEPRPKPTPSPKDTITASVEEIPEKQAPPEKKTDEAEKVASENTEPAIRERAPEVIITDSLPERTAITPKRTSGSAARSKAKKPLEKEPQAPDSEEKIIAVETPETPVPKPVRNKRAPKEKLPDPLENIRLVILFKDGATIERPMSEVFKLSVDKGILTVISKNGSVGRYSILNVARVTIE